MMHDMGNVLASALAQWAWLTAGMCIGHVGTRWWYRRVKNIEIEGGQGHGPEDV